MMWRRGAWRRLVHAVTTTAAVAAIVLGSVVGLDDWADGAATHGASTASGSDLG